MQNILKISTSIFIICFFVQWGQSQTKPIIFPNDIGAINNGVKCYCKPGIKNKSRSRGLTLSYKRLTSGEFEPDTDNISAPLSTFNTFQSFQVGLKIPVINKPAFKVLLGYKYELESYTVGQVGGDFNNIFTALDGKKLKHNSYSMYISKPIDEKQYLAFRLRAAYNGDYDKWVNFDSRYAIYNLLGTYGFKPSDDMEWGAGLIVTKRFKKDNVLALPFFFYNRNFNERWGLEAVLPVSIYMRNNINPKTILLMGAEYNGQSYSVDFENNGDPNTPFSIDHSELMIQFSLEREIVPWIWINGKIGYQVNFSSDFRIQSSATDLFKVDPTNGVIFKVGLFLSPPDKFMEKAMK